MDIYHIWCDLKAGTQDLEFIEAAEAYLDALKANGQLTHYRVTRRKLGLGHPSLGEFHLMLEFENLAQLDAAFSNVSTRSDPVESFHYAVNSKVSSVSFALYRDFPDPNRAPGDEKF